MKKQSSNNPTLYGEVILFDRREGPSLEVRLEKETVWLTQQQIASLFGIKRPAITKHLRNIFSSNELSENLVCSILEHTAADGKLYKTKFYSLDIIISVGYRVNSKRATQFRIWATNTLHKHLVQGFTLNEKRLRIAHEKYNELRKSISLLENMLSLEGVADETRGLIQVISSYSRALDVLDDHDHERLSSPEGTWKALFEMTYEEGMMIIGVMREKFGASGFFGREKDKSFQGSLSALNQTFGGKDLYPTLELKAAHLLYFVTKNHSFVDGNKRIAAALFICFLQKNRILLRKDGGQRIDNNALVALTLLVASSRPAEKENVIKVILNLLGS